VVGPDGELLCESSLCREAVDIVRAFTADGRAGSQGRVVVLAATQWESYGLMRVRYLELAPEGPSWVTERFRNSGEPPMVLVPDLARIGDRAVCKMSIFTLPGEDGWAPIDHVVQSLRECLDETGTEVIQCGATQCEILPRCVNKGFGVLRLLGCLGGIPPSAILAIGGVNSDVAMLKFAGVGAAVANADAEARNAADVVVAPCEEDGVAEAIRRVVFRELPT